MVPSVLFVPFLALVHARSHSLLCATCPLDLESRRTPCPILSQVVLYTLARRLPPDLQLNCFLHPPRAKLYHGNMDLTSNLFTTLLQTSSVVRHIYYQFLLMILGLASTDRGDRTARPGSHEHGRGPSTRSRVLASRILVHPSPAEPHMRSPKARRAYREPQGSLEHYIDTLKRCGAYGVSAFFALGRGASELSLEDMG